MNTYIKINSINYPAEIYGHVHDREWDNRESKVIILSMTIQEALDLFTDNVQWSIVYGTQTIPQDEFIVAGPITDNRNGTVSVRMGKPTAAEVSSVITGDQIANIYGKYYFDPEDGKTYLCERIGEAEGGKIVLQYLPHELIGNYFSEA